MKLFIKAGYIKPLNKIVIIKDDMQTLNPTEEMVIEDGWVEYKTPEPTDSEKLEMAKVSKIAEIADYDTSSAVNEFYVQGYPIWLDKATRSGLKLRFEAELQSGITETALWYNGVQFPIPVELGIQILLAVELYASACYDNTQKHMANVQALTTVEEVEAYDYTTGYPEKLSF
jgi:hypothetical protein